eukprot:CAMPEP_0119376682 /NCGR_PEP_ID=MMETSP1334-20130426/40747_1 /TAXON_ID=127549 /ORGANISM="Calcidiscus leptoporus, Strain RCC1130" /LENGTH=47 /DNA_ID= /DNA_START= /DNA_END= /DNA_ORIENTATION=
MTTSPPTLHGGSGACAGTGQVPVSTGANAGGGGGAAATGGGGGGGGG